MATPAQIYDEADKLKDEGRLPEAVAKLETLIEQQPNYALAFSALAVMYGRLGQHPKAVQAAQMVCQLEPQDPFSFTALSVTCQRAGLIPQAEEAMARARMMQGH